MARLFKATYKDRKGQKRQSSKWYVEFRDHNDCVRRLPAFTDKAATSEFGRKIDKLVSFHRASGGQLDPDLVEWLETLPSAIKTKLIEIRLVDSRRVMTTKSLSEHLADFRKNMAAKGNSADYVELMCGRAQRIIEGCGFTFWSDISASRVMSFLHDLRQGEEDASGQGISAQTFNFYLQAVKQFCRWMVKDRRASESPLDHLKGLNVKIDRRHDRRAHTVEQLRILLDTTRNGPDRRGRTWQMTGPERAMLYQLAMETGFRSTELRSLTPVSFDLDADPPTVAVGAAYSKRKRQDTLPLRRNTAETLRSFLTRLAPSTPLFKMPSKRDVVRLILKPDLKAAGIPYVDDTGCFADFHSLRHSFITNLGRTGTHPKTAQDLARHSTPMLTARYTHGFKGDEVSAIEALPDLSRSECEPVKATGTDNATADGPDSVLAFCLAPKGGSDAISTDSGGLKRAKKSDHTTYVTHGQTKRNVVRSSSYITPGGVAERLNAPVLKTGVAFGSPRVRIPPPPLFLPEKPVFSARYEWLIEDDLGNFNRPEFVLVFRHQPLVRLLQYVARRRMFSSRRRRTRMHIPKVVVCTVVVLACAGGARAVLTADSFQAIRLIRNPYESEGFEASRADGSVYRTGGISNAGDLFGDAVWPPDPEHREHFEEAVRWLRSTGYTAQVVYGGQEHVVHRDHGGEPDATATPGKACEPRSSGRERGRISADVWLYRPVYLWDQ